MLFGVLLLSDAYDICNVLKEGKSMKPIRILHVVTYMGRGGLETMLMNYYRQIDRSKVQFDFLVHRDFEADYDDEILKLGGKIYHMPRLNPWDYHYLKKLDEFFQQHKEYKIVHSHLDCLSAYPLKAAKKNGVPVRIAHAHTTLVDTNLKKYIKLFSKKKISKYATNLFACGQRAGKWMFEGQPFQIMNNAIDTKKYLFCLETREKIRKEFHISEDEYVIGHVGNFTLPKNHTFIINLFYEICKKNKKVKLILVGGGNDGSQYKEKAEKLKIADKIIFTGVRNDVPDLMQAFDVFLFPSIYEGLPVTLVEAQAAGLHCIVSDQVTREVAITKLIEFISLDENINTWIDCILKYKNSTRENMLQKIQRGKYDIVENARWLEEFYTNGK